MAVVGRQVTRTRRVLVDLAIVLALCVLGWGTWRGEQNRTNQLRANRENVARLQITNQKQSDTIKLLCSNIPITDGVIESILALFPKGQKLSPQAALFQTQLISFHLALLDQQTSPESPCASP